MVSRKSAFALTVMLLGSSVAQASAPATITLPSWVSVASAQSAAQSVGTFFQTHGKAMVYFAALATAWEVTKVVADKSFAYISPKYNAKFHECLSTAKVKVGLKKCNGVVKADCASKPSIVKSASSATSTATATGSAGAAETSLSSAADEKANAEKVEKKSLRSDIALLTSRFDRLEDFLRAQAQAKQASEAPSSLEDASEAPRG